MSKCVKCDKDAIAIGFINHQAYYICQEHKIELIKQKIKGVMIKDLHIHESAKKLMHRTKTKEEKIELKKDKDLLMLEEYGHVYTVKGQTTVNLQGFLALAHKYKIESAHTEIIEHDRENKFCLVKCIVKGSRGTYTGYGDCSPETTKKYMEGAYIRIAETRSIVRALKLFCGIGLTGSDELPAMIEDNK